MAYYEGGKSKSKAVPAQVRTGSEGSRKLKLQDFKTVGMWRWQGCQPYAPAAFNPQKIFLVLISFRVWADTKAIVMQKVSYIILKE